MEEELLKEHPEFKNLLEHTLVLDASIYQEYSQDSKILLPEENNPFGKEISYKLLHDLISNPKYYKYLKKLFADILSTLRIGIYTYGDIKVILSLTKREVIKAINYLLEHNLISFTTEEKTQYEELSSSMSFETFKLLVANEIFNISINNKEYHFPVMAFIDFLSLPEENYTEVIANNRNQTLNGFDKRLFAYACTSYFSEELLSKYFFPRNLTTRLKALKEYKQIDYESLEKLKFSEDDITSKVKINPELKEYVLKSMPPNYSKLEKAIYIYFKLCEALTYDEEYYAANEDKRVKIKHEYIGHIHDISPSNHNAVCYEINAIYAKFLRDLGLNIRIVRGTLAFYGDGHENLEFACDKFLVRADTVTSVLKGDLFHIKMGMDYEGLKPLNKNPDTREEFYNIARKVYEDIKKTRHNPDSKISPDYFAEVTSYYNMVQNKDVPCPTLEERLEMFLTKLSSINLEGMDRISYILKLNGMLFPFTESRSKIKVTIISNNSPKIPNKVAIPEVLISYNKEDFYISPDLTSYFILTKDNILKPITKEELESKFATKDFAIYDEDITIPGINTRR